MSCGPFHQLTSVTRWLLVVAIGAAILEMAAPNLAAGPEESPRSGGIIIYPKDSPERPASPPGAEPARSSLPWLAAALLLGGGGVWLFWQKRRGLAGALAGRRIRIEETKSLGNRQHLTLVTCEGQRFLLGISPGQIQLVAEIDSDPADLPEATS